MVSALTIADQAVADIDDRCGEQTCLENQTAGLAPIVNDSLRQSMLGGEVIVLVEIAGIDPGYDGSDCAVTVKFYSALDADEPPFPANNLQIPTGGTGCCEFSIDGSSLQGSPLQARARFAARIERGRLTTSSRAELPTGILPLTETTRIKLASAGFTARVGDLSNLRDAVLSGAIPARDLSLETNSYCDVVSPGCPVTFPEQSTFLDVFTSLIGQPDIDLDDDGLECFYERDGDGIIDACCESGGSICSAEPCQDSPQPVQPNRPATCAANPEFADGFSASFLLQGERATIVGR